MSDDTDIEELREQTQKGKRTSGAADSQQEDLADDVGRELAAIADGKRKTLAVRDESLSALFNALEGRPAEMDAVLAELAEAAGKDVEDPTKSDLTRLAARVGLQTAAPETWEALLEARRNRAVEEA